MIHPTALHLASVLALSLASFAAFAEEPKPLSRAEAARHKVWEFERGLATGLDAEADANEPAIREFFAGLESSEEKIAFVGMTNSRYVYAISRPLAVELLLQLMKDPDVDVRAEAAEGLAYNGGAGKIAPEILVALLRRDDPEIQESALRAMGASGNRAFEPYLLECLASPDPSLRSRAPFYLERLSGGEHAAEIAALLHDPEEEVRASALSALSSRMAGEAFVPEIAARLEDESPKVRENALEALASLGATGQAEAIAARLEDENDWVRATAAKALADLKLDGKADAVAALLDDDEVRPRRLAAEALQAIGDARHRKALQAALDDEDEQVRGAARAALLMIEAREKQATAARGSF